MKHPLSLIILITFIPLSTVAQKITSYDSLLVRLNAAGSDSQKVKLLISIGNETRDFKPAESARCYYNALRLASVSNNQVLKADCFQRLGQLFTRYIANYDSAGICYQECLKIRLKDPGEKHQLYAGLLTDMAELYLKTGKYQESEKLLLKAKEIYSQTVGEKNPDYAGCILMLAYLYVKNGNFSGSLPLSIKASIIYKETLGENSRDYARALHNLALVYHKLDRYEESEKLYLITLPLRRQLLGPENPEYAQTLNNFAALYIKMGKYEEALPLCIESKNIRKKLLGELHPEYAEALLNLGLAYQRLGNYGEAELIYQDVRRIRKEVLGEKHPNYFTILSLLATFYRQMGNYAAAEPLYIESVNLRRIYLGENHPDYAIALNNYAMFCKSTGKYGKADSLFRVSIDIRRKIFGEKSPSYALVLSNLADLDRLTGNYSEAEKLILKSLSIKSETQGTMNPGYSISLNLLGELYYLNGKYPDAERIFIQNLELRKKILGEQHTLYVESLLKLAKLYFKTGNMSLSEKYYLEGLGSISHIINKNFAFLSEKEKELYLRTKSSSFDEFYSFALTRKDENKEITGTVYDYVIRNKGLLLKSSSAMKRAVLQSRDTSLITDYNRWIAIRKQLSESDSTDSGGHLNRNSDLELRANDLEKKLVRNSQVFSDFDRLQKLSWTDVRKNLGRGDAAVEFLRFQPGNPKDSILYCALVIVPKSKYPVMVRLCSENEIVGILEANTQNDISGIRNVYGTNHSADNRLYIKIWKPLEKYLKGASTVYYSPDGLLHEISFPAVHVDKDIFLSDRYRLNRLSSTGKLVEKDEKTDDGKISAGLFGGIDYGVDSTSEPVWKQLPGTRNETDKIDGLLRNNKINADYYSGKNATEGALKLLCSSSSPAILHVATHGFFFPDPEIRGDVLQKEVSRDTLVFRGRTGSPGLWQFVMNPNPLMRSGLVFAGANDSWNKSRLSSGEDGVLTAQEVAQLDLRNTRLVVMSACETGLGDIRGSEGVYGLQRAFKMAGVKYLIMSLWQVPDNETSEFMIMFYQRLLEKKDIMTSFTESQKIMRKKYDPYFWGAFVLIE